MIEDNKALMQAEGIEDTKDIAKADLITVDAFKGGASPELFSSIQATDRKSAAKLYNAVNGQGESLSDNIGAVLEITDFVAHKVTLEDEVTKEPIIAWRAVLISKDGKAYHSVSNGVVSSLQKIISIVGQPSWDPALKVIPAEVKTRRGFKTLTLRLQA